MNMRTAKIGGAVLLLLAAAGGGGWYALSPETPESENAADSTPIPIPPVPPRIAQGADYETCLQMLNNDPSGAASFAESWAGRGGGDGALHCLALSKIALGTPAAGAAMLAQLATDSHAPPAARATVYGQATQAWRIAGDLDHAFDTATQAVALSPDDADLLIDRAIAAGDLGRYPAEIDDLTRALAIDPHRVDALTDRATAWRHMGQIDRAEDDVDQALAADPDNPEALLERGILRQRRNDPGGARTDWQRTITLAPDSATADLAEQNLALLEAGPDRR
jgi:tetratricopeptide (TPR) repeat protein